MIFFSPVAKVASIRLILYVVVAFYFEVEQMEVKTTFFSWGSGRRDIHEAT